MARTADDRLTTQAAKRFGGDRTTDKQIEAAHDLAEAEHMTYEEALAIVSGATRRPYGTPRYRR